MKIILNALVVLGFAIALFVVTRTFTIPHKEYYENKEEFIFSTGNAPLKVKNEITKQLIKFQDAYTARDINQVDDFAEELFSKENILILGTMPNEIYSGFEAAKDLTQSDWAYWGDVKLLMNNANISSKDSVAWVSTIGYVEFDLSSMLVLPLRFTGVLVNDGLSWKFQQNQWQFDLDNIKILLSIILIFLMLCVSFLRLVFVIYKFFRKK